MNTPSGNAEVVQRFEEWLALTTEYDRFYPAKRSDILHLRAALLADRLPLPTSTPDDEAASRSPLTVTLTDEEIERRFDADVQDARERLSKFATYLPEQYKDNPDSLFADIRTVLDAYWWAASRSPAPPIAVTDEDVERAERIYLDPESFRRRQPEEPKVWLRRVLEDFNARRTPPRV